MSEPNDDNDDNIEPTEMAKQMAADFKHIRDTMSNRWRYGAEAHAALLESAAKLVETAALRGVYASHEKQ